MSGRIELAPVGSHEPWPLDAVFEVPGDVAAQMWSEAGRAAQELAPWVATVGKAAQEERIRKLVGTARPIGKLLPQEVQQAAREFAAQGNEAGALLIRGLNPPEAVSKVQPACNRLPDDISEGRAAALMATAVSSAFGLPITYSTYPEVGETITSGFIRSAAPQPDGKRNLDSGRPIGWHTEGFTGWRPGPLTLFGIRGDKETQTAILPANRIVERLSEQALEVLTKSAFRIADSSSESPQPVIMEVARRQAIAFFRSETVPFEEGDLRSVEALEELIGVLNDPQTSVTYHILQAGEVLAIDNHGLHGRTGLPLDSSRWMLREFVAGAQHNGGDPVVRHSFLVPSR